MLFHGVSVIGSHSNTFDSFCLANIRNSLTLRYPFVKNGKLFGHIQRYQRIVPVPVRADCVHGGSTYIIWLVSE